MLVFLENKSAGTAIDKQLLMVKQTLIEMSALSYRFNLKLILSGKLVSCDRLQYFLHTKGE